MGNDTASTGTGTVKSTGCETIERDYDAGLLPRATGVDGLIEEVCRASNTIPLPWGDITKHISIWNECFVRGRAAKGGG